MIKENLISLKEQFMRSVGIIHSSLFRTNYETDFSVSVVLNVIILVLVCIELYKREEDIISFFSKHVIESVMLIIIGLIGLFCLAKKKELPRILWGITKLLFKSYVCLCLSLAFMCFLVVLFCIIFSDIF